MAKEFAGWNFTMYSSDLKRAKQTAELIGGVSRMFVNDEGKRFIKKISDMSYIQ